MKTIALLGTGDEIINGDILNTNAQHIAQQLIANNMQPGNHMVAADSDTDLQSAMHYLLDKHDALITIGGLGPTSDDLTRFALAKVLEQSLKFDQESWEMIEARLKKFNLAIPESNKQQCLFPQEGTVLKNAHGTANGCKISWQGKIIYMLPGPPNECLPMFTKQVLEDLMQRGFVSTTHRQSWMVLGASEGSMAEIMDKIVANHEVDIGYRVDYPYLEIKCQSADKQQLAEVAAQIEKTVGNNLVSQHRQTASELLVEWLQAHTASIHIDDSVTGGLLETRIHSPNNATQLYFNDEPEDHIGTQVVLTGLRSYWQQNDSIETDSIKIVINHDGDITETNLPIPYRGKRMRAMACESISWHLLQTFIRIFDDNNPTHLR